MGHTEVIQLLLKNGADANYTDKVNFIIMIDAIASYSELDSVLPKHNWVGMI